MNTKLNVNLTSRGAGYDGVSLNLEQDKEYDTLNVYDIQRMWSLARAGKSARTYKPYDAYIKISETSVTFSIGFYVWTVPYDLDYELSTSLGEIGIAEEIDREREESIVFPLSKSVNFGRVITDFDYVWETPLIDELGKAHLPLGIVPGSHYVEIDKPYFGVARAKYRELGHKHYVTTTINTMDDKGNKITVEGIDITITALWKDSNGSLDIATLKLDIPEAVSSALRMCGGRPNLICYKCPDDFIAEIYYNDCNGDVLDINIIELSKREHWCLPG